MVETPNSSNAGATPVSNGVLPAQSYHHNDCEEQVSHTPRNPFRRFIRYRNRGVNDCGFFQWVDEPMPEFQRHRVALLKSDKDVLEEEMKGKAVQVEELASKLRREDTRIAVLKARLDRLQAARNDLRWRSALLMTLVFNAGIGYAVVEIPRRNQ